jgi:hypothetical protein
MSLSMKTVHLSLETGETTPSVLWEYSLSGQSSLKACSSMKLPVPAAQTVFMTDEVTIPSDIVVNLAS